MPNPLIREARLDDAPVLLSAERETARTPGLLVSHPDELKLQAFERKIAALAQTGRYIVAEKDGRIAGHALLDPMPLAAISHVFRLTIVVHPGFTGQGVGTALMRDLMDWAKRSPHVIKIELLVRATNERAIHLYSKLLQVRIYRGRPISKAPMFTGWKFHRRFSDGLVSGTQARSTMIE